MTSEMSQPVIGEDNLVCSNYILLYPLGSIPILFYPLDSIPIIFYPLGSIVILFYSLVVLGGY